MGILEVAVLLDQPSADPPSRLLLLLLTLRFMTQINGEVKGYVSEKTNVIQRMRLTQPLLL